MPLQVKVSGLLLETARIYKIHNLDFSGEGVEKIIGNLKKKIELAREGENKGNRYLKQSETNLMEVKRLNKVF